MSNMEYTFDSSEHAFLWKKCIECGFFELAERVKNAVHAGAAKALVEAELKGKIPEEWFEQNVDIMKEVIHAKARQVPEFSRALRQSKGQILAEPTNDEFWATGIASPYLVNKCKPEYWKGANTLGQIQMAERDLLDEKPNITLEDVMPKPEESGVAHESDNNDCSSTADSEEDTGSESEVEEKKETPSKKGFLSKVFGRRGSDQTSITSFYQPDPSKKRKKSSSPLHENKKKKEKGKTPPKVKVPDDSHLSPFVHVDIGGDKESVKISGESSNHPPQKSLMT